VGIEFIVFQIRCLDAVVEEKTLSTV